MKTKQVTIVVNITINADYPDRCGEYSCKEYHLGLCGLFGQDLEMIDDEFQIYFKRCDQCLNREIAIKDIQSQW